MHQPIDTDLDPQQLELQVKVSQVRSQQLRQLRDRRDDKRSDTLCLVLTLVVLSTAFGYYWASQAYSRTCPRPFLSRQNNDRPNLNNR
ncbi:hypothetical protein [Synechococcus elongatus]|uniref:hypothetical protein n=1 Tax=Synechococcus elongatus TaxID=32046 RepID=UPI000F7F86C8|nr:hypothetical protein [Synechococcus elongatus]